MVRLRKGPGEGEGRKRWKKQGQVLGWGSGCGWEDY